MGSLASLKPPAAQTGPRALDQVLRAAPRRPAWAPTPISHDTLEQLHALMSVGPSMIDASPTQVLFLNSPRAKHRLAPHLTPATRDAIAKAESPAQGLALLLVSPEFQRR